MCGIAGIWQWNGPPVPEEDIGRFTDSLAHRGPDGRGIWREDAHGVALGHRRLAILDPTEDGRQPMVSACGRYCIVFNGEVYNFLELRRDLESRGARFRSQSDTEVILAAYAEWGPQALTRFNGMWAFAIYDRSERTLFLARDRFGVKPLLYRYTQDALAFASELKAFRCLRTYQPQLDWESARITLEAPFALAAGPHTLFQGVGSLPPGHCATVRNGVLSINRWWNTLDHLETVPDSLAGQAELFRERFWDAVRLRLRSDVPVGCCLSGGFDSSAIACTLAELASEPGAPRQAKDWKRCFVATFPGARNDERPQAEAVVNFTKLRSHFISVMETDPLESMEKILLAMDDVYPGLPHAPWLIYRALRQERVVVSLDGHGADELMGGYRPAEFLWFHDASAPWRAPLDNLRRAAGYLHGLPPARSPTTVWEHALELGQAVWRHHPSLKPLRTARQHAGTLTRILRRGHHGNSLRVGGPLPPIPNTDPSGFPEHWGSVNRELYRLTHATVLPTLLRNFDRVSMAHGVESRMPFLDWRLVTLVMSLPDSSKISAGWTKRVAREAMAGHMPEAIRSSRVKVGFNSPMPEWLAGPLQPWVNSILASAPLDHGLVNVPQLRALVHQRNKAQGWSWNNCEEAWKHIHFLWFEQAFVRQQQPSAALCTPP